MYFLALSFEHTVFASLLNSVKESSATVYLIFVCLLQQNRVNLIDKSVLYVHLEVCNGIYRMWNVFTLYTCIKAFRHFSLSNILACKHSIIMPVCYRNDVKQIIQRERNELNWNNQIWDCHTRNSIYHCKENYKQQVPVGKWYYGFD